MARVRVVTPEPERASSRRSGVRLVLDDEAWLRVDAAELIELGVHDGDEIDDARRHQLETALMTTRARRFVVRSLAARAQSVAELRAKLAQREIPPEIVEAALEQARGYGYLDDSELAAQLARGHKARGYGPRRAEASLRARKLEPDVAQAAIDAVFEPTREQDDALLALGAREFGPGEPGRRKAVGFLVRRGFSVTAAWVAVNQRERNDR